MKFHIVRDGESTKDIMFIYSLSIDELKEYNKHIRDWKKLIPGTKLKVPVITEDIDQDIMDMEPFVEDYYPRNPIVGEKVEKKETENHEQNVSDVEEDKHIEEENIVLENEKRIDVEEVKQSKEEKIELEKENKKKEDIPPKIIYQYVPVYYYIPYFYNPKYPKVKK